MRERMDEPITSFLPLLLVLFAGAALVGPPNGFAVEVHLFFVDTFLW